MIGKRLCSMSHPAPVRGERARFIEERMKGVLWRHSSVNLVEPRPSHRPRHRSPAMAGDRSRVSIAMLAPPQPRLADS